MTPRPKRPWKVRTGLERTRSFATFGAAYDYCIEAGLDPDDIENITPKSRRHRHAYRQSFHDDGCSFDLRPHRHHRCACGAEWSQPKLTVAG